MARTPRLIVDNLIYHILNRANSIEVIFREERDYEASEEDEEKRLEKIRYAVRRGCPFGKESWIKEMALKLGLASTLNPVGKPKKST
jgi:hypothetical protein